MKKSILSVWGLTARAMLPMTLLTGLVMTSAEAILFPLQSLHSARLDEAFSNTWLTAVFVIALAGLHALFCLCGTLGARTALPYARLGISERGLFLIRAGQAALCLGILLAWQLGLALALAMWWSHAHPGAIGPQTLYVAVYRSSLLHALLPLGDRLLWVRNLVLCAALGFCAAKAEATRRITGPVIVGTLAALTFPTGMNYGIVVPIQIALLLAAAWMAWMMRTDTTEPAGTEGFTNGKEPKTAGD